MKSWPYTVKHSSECIVLCEYIPARSNYRQYKHKHSSYIVVHSCSVAKWRSKGCEYFWIRLIYLGGLLELININCSQVQGVILSCFLFKGFGLKYCSDCTVIAYMMIMLFFDCDDQEINTKVVFELQYFPLSVVQFCSLTFFLFTLDS